MRSCKRKQKRIEKVKGESKNGIQNLDRNRNDVCTASCKYSGQQQKERNNMKRVILDTNIYGRIIGMDDTDLVLASIAKSGIVVCSCDVIRKELRKMSKERITISYGKKRKLRSLILGLYHNLVKRDLPVTEEVIGIAGLYYSTYMKLGGMISRNKIMNDFIIVSLASKNNLDIVYSDDSDTMLSYLSIKSYDIVNAIKKLRTPQFKKYGDFKNDIS